MTKLEQIKAAYEAATPGEWKLHGSGMDKWGEEHSFDFVEVAPDRYIDCEGLTMQEANSNAAFIALAHNTMPLLLEAVELLREMDNDYGYNRSDEKRIETLTRVRKLLEKLQ